MSEIGGPNIVIECDESAYGKSKYNRNRYRWTIQVFEMVERTPERRIVLKMVPQRDKKRSIN